jgi:hypothetical protein
MLKVKEISDFHSTAFVAGVQKEKIMMYEPVDFFTTAQRIVNC